MSYYNNVKIIMNEQDFKKLQNYSIKLNKEDITSYGNIILKYNDIPSETFDFIVNFLHSCQNSYYYKRDEYEGFYIAPEDEFIANDFLKIAREI